MHLPSVPRSDWWQRSLSACTRRPHLRASLSCRAWRRLAASWCAVFWAPAPFSVRAGVSYKVKNNNNTGGGKEEEETKYLRRWENERARQQQRGIMVPQWRQKQRGSGCSQPMVRQRERGCHAMGPCLFNHVQLHFIALPVMATKPQPLHIVVA